MRYEQHDLDGQGKRRCRVFDMSPNKSAVDAWASVTDVPCPVPKCPGYVRWAEAGYVPGYRICDICRRHYLAWGTTDRPTLIQMPKRR